MRSAVVVFPASNCDRDAEVALARITGTPPIRVWHRDGTMPAVDLIVLPGGFSFGDYLRPGAMAGVAPVMREVVRMAKAGVPVLGICNGFQILTESGLLPGALLRNAGLRFVCRDVHLKVERAAAPYTTRYSVGQVIRVPIAHHDGNYFADSKTLDRLEGEGRVAFRYCRPEGVLSDDANPNGSARHIAGIVNETGTVLGMMPHPERVADPMLGGIDGRTLFESVLDSLS